MSELEKIPYAGDEPDIQAVAPGVVARPPDPVSIADQVRQIRGKR